MDKANQIALDNSRDLVTIIEWCVKHQIKAFRVGSDIFPRITEVGYAVDDLKNGKQIREFLSNAGKLAADNNILLSCHPGPFTIISSPREEVNVSGAKEIEYHSMLGDLLYANSQGHFTINFHINSSYGGNYDATRHRFVDNFNRLTSKAKSRVILENDDRKAGWSVQKLYNMIFSVTGIPITFDIHHWNLCHDGDTMEHDYALAKSTWNGISNQVHYSESPTADKLIPKHSEYYRTRLPAFIEKDLDCHVHLEAKAKEKALFDYVSKFGYLTT